MALDENIKADNAVSELTVSNLNVDTGLKLLLDKLDLTFKAEKVDYAYSANSNFNVFVKKEGLSMNDYILEFEHLYCKIAEHHMKLPDTILAFKLLDGAGLNEAQRQLALTLGNNLTLSSMKSALKRIFSRSVDQAETSEVKIKEDAFFVKRRNDFSRQHNKGGAVARTGNRKEMNSLDRNGQISRCVVCDSKMHWAKDCPHGKNIKQQSANVTESDGQQVNDKGYEECELILLAKEPDKFQIFVADAAKSAVVDTACTKAVGGLHWFNSYVDSLDEEQRKKVEIIESNASFKIGDGRQVKSQKRARIPAQIGDKSCLIEMKIVKENIPLLLSKSSLKKAETVL